MIYYTLCPPKVNSGFRKFCDKSVKLQTSYIIEKILLCEAAVPAEMLRSIAFHFFHFFNPIYCMHGPLHPYIDWECIVPAHAEQCNAAGHFRSDPRKIFKRPTTCFAVSIR